MKKLFALILAILMVASLAACSGDTETETADTNDTTAEELIMGTNAYFPPYEYYDADGTTIVGIDAEIAQAVADKLGMKLTIKDMDFDSLLTAVQTGSVDIVFAGLTVTEERQQAVDFTVTYATGIQVIIVPNDSDIASVDDLAGKTIGVQAGTTGDIYCTGDYGQDSVKQFQNGALAVAALQNGQVDCVVIDNEPAKSFVEANEGLKILDTEYITEDYAAAISKDNADLTTKVNNAMEELKADGTIDAIIAKYIKAE
ncbi:MAG: transporter substrate-binding domain-containing protein [Eubacteriales bacterium]|nr:transporter substrate-binding domain-containing protein [Eubacteriales bacterium]